MHVDLFGYTRKTMLFVVVSNEFIKDIIINDFTAIFIRCVSMSFFFISEVLPIVDLIFRTDANSFWSFSREISNTEELNSNKIFAYQSY